MTSHRCRSAGRALPALLLLLGPGLVLAQQGYWSERFGFGLWVPSGYAVQELQEGTALLLVPQAAGGVTVEVVAWPKTTRTDGCNEGARQHEALLRNRFHYRRDRVREVLAADGTPGVLVEGTVDQTDRRVYTATFACFSTDQQHYVLGTFAPEGSGASAAALVEAVASGLTQDQAKLPTSRVAPEPMTTPPDREPVPVLGGGEPPVGAGGADIEVPRDPGPVAVQPSGTATQGPGGVVEPPPVPSVSGAGALYRDRSGFSVWVPDGWALSTTDGVVTVESPGTGAGALIWPVRQVAPGLRDSLTKDLVCASCEFWRSIEVTSIRPHPTRDNVQLIAARIKTDQHRLAAVFSYALTGRDGVLAGAFAPEEAMDLTLPALAQIVRSFRGGPWPCPEPGEVAGMALTDWTAPDRTLRLRLPAGWEATAGVVSFNGDPRVRVEAHAPAPSLLRVAWEQPVVPSFREATPLLASLGWQEGAQYTARMGPDPLLILRRMGPEEYLRGRILAPGQSAALDQPTVTPLGDVAEETALLAGAGQETAAFAVRGERNGLPVAQMWVVSTGDEPPGRGANIWQAAYLGCGGLPGELDTAKACLRQIVRSAQPLTVGDGGTVTGVVALAQEVARSGWLAPEQPEGAPYAAVLASGAGPPTGGGQPYQQPADWQAVWESGQPGTTGLWEFTTAWWRKPGDRPGGAG